ncbi:MAG: ribosomal protein S18-alanine N-acetyltransferase, partial [Candidatus Methanoperedens sp.]|nr:ribosomal protein S18-alanine N-acetyltransferase [Candidatus Methanoperedens sp.]
NNVRPAINMRAAAPSSRSRSPPGAMLPQSRELRLESYKPRFFRRLFAIESSVFTDDRYNLELFRHLCEDNRDLLLVARLGNRTIGYVMGEPHPRGAEVISLAVSPRYRNRGVGRRLMRRLLIRMERTGIVRVFLMVREGNAAAISLYRSLGFRRVRRVPEYYGDGEAAIRMRLEFD